MSRTDNQSEEKGTKTGSVIAQNEEIWFYHTVTKQMVCEVLQFTLRRTVAAVAGKGSCEFNVHHWPNRVAGEHLDHLAAQEPDISLRRRTKNTADM